MTAPDLGTGSGPGASLVPRWGIIAFSVIVVALGLMSLYSLWELWPTGTQASGSTKQAISWLGWRSHLDREFLFFLTVAIAGGVGGLIHTLEKLRALASQVFTEAPHGADSIRPVSNDPAEQPPEEE